MTRVVCALLLFVSLRGFATDFFVKDCANNGDGSARTCAASPGGAGAWDGDATFSNVAFGTDANEVGPGDTLYICGEIRGRLATAQGGTAQSRMTINFDCPSDSGSISGLSVVSSFTGSGPWNTTSTFTTPWNLLRDSVPLRSGVYGSLSKDEWQWNNLAAGDDKIYLGFDPSGHTIEVSTINNAVQLDEGADYIDLVSPRAYYINYGSSAIRIYSNYVTVSSPDVRYSRGGVDVRSNAHDVTVTDVYCEKVNACLDINTDTPSTPGDDRPYNIEFDGGTIRGVVQDPLNITSTWTYEIELQILNGVGAIDEECIGSTDAGDNITYKNLDIGYCGSWFVATLDDTHDATGYEVTDNVVHNVNRGIMTANSGAACFKNVDISRNRFFDVGDPFVNEYVLAVGGDGSGCSISFDDNDIYRAVQGLLIQAGTDADLNRNTFSKMTSRQAGWPSYFVLFANADGTITGDNNRYFGDSPAPAYSGRWRWKGLGATTSFSTFQSQAAPFDANSTTSATPRDASSYRITSSSRAAASARTASAARTQAQR